MGRSGVGKVQNRSLLIGGEWSMHTVCSSCLPVGKSYASMFSASHRPCLYWHTGTPTACLQSSPVILSPPPTVGARMKGVKLSVTCLMSVAVYVMQHGWEAKCGTCHAEE